MKSIEIERLKRRRKEALKSKDKQYGQGLHDGLAEALEVIDSLVLDMNESASSFCQEHCDMAGLICDECPLAGYGKPKVEEENETVPVVDRTADVQRALTLVKKSPTGTLVGEGGSPARKRNLRPVDE